MRGFRVQIYTPCGVEIHREKKTIPTKAELMIKRNGKLYKDVIIISNNRNNKCKYEHRLP